MNLNCRLSNLFSSQTTVAANKFKYTVVSLEALSMFTAQQLKETRIVGKDSCLRSKPATGIFALISLKRTQSLYEAAFCIKNEVDVEPEHSKQAQ